MTATISQHMLFNNSIIVTDVIRLPTVYLVLINTQQENEQKNFKWEVIDDSDDEKTDRLRWKKKNAHEWAIRQ